MVRGQFHRSEGSMDATRTVDRCLPRAKDRRTKVAWIFVWIVVVGRLAGTRQRFTRLPY
jgi:hypothetical protein